MSLLGVTSEFATNLYQGFLRRVADLRSVFESPKPPVQNADRMPRLARRLDSTMRPQSFPSVNDLTQQLEQMTISDDVVQPVFKAEQSYKEAVFLFADMESFSLKAKEMQPEALTALLSEIYKGFKHVVKTHGKDFDIEVVKLTGDCIMLCAKPGRVPLADQAKAMVNVGFQMLQFLTTFNKTRSEPINFRFGINIGPAAKVNVKLSDERDAVPTTDWFGEGVNFTARLESCGLPNQIQISQALHGLVSDAFDCSRCTHEVKSYGRPETFFVLHPKNKRHSDSLVQYKSQRQSSLTDVHPKEREGARSAPTLRRSKDV